MDKFSISDLARLSGIKQHTIRIWEQRYETLKPNRSEGNTRYYDSNQLRRLLNIVSASSCGYKISELSKLSDPQIFEIIKNVQLKEKYEAATEYYVSQLTAAGTAYDEVWFEKTFAHCMLRLGIFEGYVQVIYPLLQRVGLLWSADDLHPANEHFISNLLRQKMFAAIDLLPPPGDLKSSWICFLPEDEFHEMGLLLASYLLRSKGKKVIYLGSNVPLSSLKEAVTKTNCDNLLTFLVVKDEVTNISTYIKKLGNAFKTKNLFIAAPPAAVEKVKVFKNISLLHSAHDFVKIIS